MDAEEQFFMLGCRCRDHPDKKRSCKCYALVWFSCGCGHAADASRAAGGVVPSGLMDTQVVREP
jgi:hypothetical protein